MQYLRSLPVILKLEIEPGQAHDIMMTDCLFDLHDSHSFNLGADLCMHETIYAYFHCSIRRFGWNITTDSFAARQALRMWQR